MLKYIYNHFNGEYVMPEIYDSNYDVFSKPITKSNFLRVMNGVIASCNPTLVGWILGDLRKYFRSLKERTVDK